MTQIMNILEIQPNKLSTDLTSYNFLLYSEPGVGKTTLAVNMFKKHFIIGAEYGFKGIPGAVGVSVPDYFALSQYVKQLDTAEAREKFDTIIVDTSSKIGSIIEEYVLSMYGKNFMGDCKNHGGAYPLINRYYDLAFNKLKARGYNFVYICHSDVEIFRNEAGDEINRYYRPSLKDRLRKMIEPEVDYIFFLTKDKEGNRIAVTDSTTKNFGKSRSNLPTVVSIENEGKELLEALRNGIVEKGGELITEERANTTAIQKESSERDYLEVITEIKKLGMELSQKDREVAKAAMEITNNALGTNDDGVQRKLDEMTQLNYQVLIKILADLTDLKEKVNA